MSALAAALCVLSLTEPARAQEPRRSQRSEIMQMVGETELRVTYIRPGQSLNAGTYSVWAIPDSTQWTVIFNKRGYLFHLRTYVESEDALRVTAKVAALPHVETLTVVFPVVDGRKAVLQIHWGTTAVSLDIETL